MRVESIMPARVSQVSVSRQNYRQNIKESHVLERDTVSFKPRLACITFTGDGKNMKQVLSIAYENAGLGLPETYQGGMGVVTYEAPQSLIKHENLDVRSVSPFHNHNNHKGGFKFLLTKNIEKDANGNLPEQIEARWFLSAEPGVDLKAFAKLNNYDEKDLRYVIQSEPNGTEATSLSKYCLIEPTGVKGDFERMANQKISELQKVGYELFEVSKDNPSYNKIKDTPNYYMYLQELSKTVRPYTYGPNGCGGIESEILNSDLCRAVMKATEQMNTERFGFWNPASFWGHDRVIAPMMNHISSESANGNEFWNGVKHHHSIHNPGKYYQGYTDNPFEFARVVFDKEDVNSLKNHPLCNVLERFNARGWYNLAAEEKDLVNSIFEPMIGRFKDGFGQYNITKIAIEAKKTNPDNFTVGTVSPNFDKEMKSEKMDVAPGLGKDLREIETISPLNGSTPASLGLDNNTMDFGRGGNTLSANKTGYTPLNYTGDIDSYLKDKEANSRWYTDILTNAQDESQEALNKVFFNDLQIKQGRGVFGKITDFKPGKDLLVVGWGRPDEQKGFPITLEGLKKFFEMEDVPFERKKALKVQIGWGDSAFDKNSKEWKLIDKYFKEIEALEDGAYVGNIQLVDGRYPNKLVGCATHAIFTSRREMCGITPLESKTAATPYLVTATGGPVDYTNESNGWVTKTAPEMNPDFDGLSWQNSEGEIDNARRSRSSSEVAEQFKAMVNEYFDDRPSYVAKCKKNIEESLDWHNNDEFNGGMSANKMYKNKIWEIDAGWDARAKAPLKKLVGKIQTTVGLSKEMIDKLINETLASATEMLNKTKDEVVVSINNAGKVIIEQVKSTTEAAVDAAKSGAKSSKGGKTVAFAGGLAAGVLGGGAWYLLSGKSSSAEKTTISGQQSASAVVSGQTHGGQAQLNSNKNFFLRSSNIKMAG